MFRGTCDAPVEAGGGDGCAQAMGAPRPQAIGEIETAIGAVTVTSASGAVTQVKVGDPVYQHDTIETGADGAVSIAFTDGTAFKLWNNAHIVLNEFVFDSEGTSNSVLFSLAQGAFTFIAGKAANTGSLRIDTPFARIRGTGQAGGIVILTLSALAFSTIRESLAASRPDDLVDLVDDDTITPKDLTYGTFTIFNKLTGKVTEANDPTYTYEFAPDGSVTRTPKTSSQVEQGATLAQQVASLASLGQCAASGGSSTATTDPHSDFQPINFARPANNEAFPVSAAISVAQSSGALDVPQLKPPPPVLAADTGSHPIIEFPHTTGSAILDIAPAASLSFTDLKPSAVSANLVSITWSAGETPPSGLSTVLASALTTSVSTDITGFKGSVDVTFSAADKNFDFLADGETLTIVYNVTVTDSNGTSVTQPVAITISSPPGRSLPSLIM